MPAPTTSLHALLEDIVAQEGGEQARAARRLGVTTYNLNRWLGGVTPSLKQCVKLAAGTGKSFAYIVSLAYGIDPPTVPDVVTDDPRLASRWKKHLQDQYEALVVTSRAEVD